MHLSLCFPWVLAAVLYDLGVLICRPRGGHLASNCERVYQEMEPLIRGLGQHSWGSIENVRYSIKSKGSLVITFHMQNVLR